MKVAFRPQLPLTCLQGHNNKAYTFHILEILENFTFHAFFFKVFLSQNIM